MPGSQKVYLECVSPDRAKQLLDSVLGIEIHEPTLARWGMLPAQIQEPYPRSVNIAIPDFKAEDLESLRKIEGVVQANTFESETDLPDARTARRAIFSAMSRSAAA